MIRKAIIVVLILLTLVVLLIGWGSKDNGIMLDISVFRDSFTFSNWTFIIAWAASPPLGNPHRWAFAGFGYDYLVFDGVIVVSIPLWTFAGLFALYPAIAILRSPLRRWHRRRKGLYQKCGYCLTGNVTGKCPECGTTIETQP